MSERLRFILLLTLLIIGFYFIWFTHHNVDANFVESLGSIIH